MSGFNKNLAHSSLWLGQLSCIDLLVSVGRKYKYIPNGLALGTSQSTTRCS